jgi:hypothetical protein
MQPKTKECSGKLQDERKKLSSKGPLISKQANRKLLSRHKKCLHVAEWECKKKTTMAMMHKLDAKETKLAKLEHSLIPWRKEQARKKKQAEAKRRKEKQEKTKKRQAAMAKKLKVKLAKQRKQLSADQKKMKEDKKKRKEDKKKAKLEAKKANAAKKAAAMAIGCADMWPTKECQSITHKCSDHAALRFHCRVTCNACKEVFPSHFGPGRHAHGEVAGKPSGNSGKSSNSTNTTAPAATQPANKTVSSLTEFVTRLDVTDATSSRELGAAAEVTGCTDTWPTKECQSITKKCADHAAMRFHCRVTCNACKEVFPSHFGPGRHAHGEAKQGITGKPSGNSGKSSNSTNTTAPATTQPANKTLSSQTRLADITDDR